MLHGSPDYSKALVPVDVITVAVTERCCQVLKGTSGRVVCRSGYGH